MLIATIANVEELMANGYSVCLAKGNNETVGWLSIGFLRYITEISPACYAVCHGGLMRPFAFGGVSHIPQASLGKLIVQCCARSSAPDPDHPAPRIRKDVAEGGLNVPSSHA